MAQRRMDIRRQVGLGHRSERAADAAGGQDGVLLHEVAAIGIDHLDRRSAQRRRARHIGEARRRRIELHHVEGARTERRAAVTVIDEPTVPSPDASRLCRPS